MTRAETVQHGCDRDEQDEMPQRKQDGATVYDRGCVLGVQCSFRFTEARQ